MEHSKFSGFMIQCNKCSRGKSLDEEDLKRDILVCSDPECKNEFSIYEGLKNGLKKVEDHISPNFFLANEMYDAIVKVKIGYTTYVELPDGISKIYNIMLVPMGPFLASAVDITSKGFKIFTSLIDDSKKDVIGEEGMVMTMIHFKSDDYEIPWLHMLQYAFDQLRSNEFITSILLSEIAFESYIDSTLALGYSEIGLDKDSISRFLEAAKMHDKVNPLMNNLFGVKLSTSSSWGDWQKVLKWRNQIAHGTKVTATKEEALLAYQTVVDSMFHLIEGVDTYLKGNGHKQGLFYRL